MNRRLLSSDPTLGECPYCGAGIDVKNLDRRIGDLQGEIEECDTQEANINARAKDVDKSSRDLKNAIRAYDLARQTRDNLQQRAGGKEDG